MNASGGDIFEKKKAGSEMTAIWVAAGGALGAVARYVAVGLFSFPLGTLTVNVLGSFLIGVAFVLLPKGGWSPFLITGVLGGFTTFSAFSLDTLKLIETGKLGPAFGYIAASVILSLAAAAIGVFLARGAVA